MKIALKNFRCYLDSQFDFGESGLVLISAPSGKGKTTILMAIQFVLFGTGKKITMHDKSSCQVILDYSEYKKTIISRTKTPNRLILENEDGKYEGDCAQSIINKIFGDAFHLTSCIMQNSANNSFVLMSPMEKLEFLEKFAFQDLDLNSVNKKCKQVIKTKELDLVKINSEISTLEIIIAESKKTESTEKNAVTVFPLKCSLKNRDVAVKNEYTKFKNCEITLKKQTRILETLVSQFHESQTREKTNQLKKEQLENIVSKIESIQKEYIDLDTLEFKLSRIKKCKLKREYKKNQTILKDAKRNEIEISKSAIDDLKSKVWNERAEEETSTLISDYKNIIDELKNIESKFLTE